MSAQPGVPPAPVGPADADRLPPVPVGPAPAPSPGLFHRPDGHPRGTRTLGRRATGRPTGRHDNADADGRGRAEFVAALRTAGLPVRADDGSRAQYATDASLYRIPPLAVARPRDAAEVAAALTVCRDLGVPLTVRGAGTSVAGNAIGPGLVLDLSRHLHHILEVDPTTATALVQPGVVQADLQRAAAVHGLRFGPDPSTSSRATIGGMIGNDACGARSLAHGRTADNLAGLTALTAAGEPLSSGYSPDGRPVAELPAGLRARIAAAVDPYADTARREFDRFARQVSGYAAAHLTHDRFDLTRALTGSEGTLVVLTQARVKLVRDPAHRVLVVLGYPDIVAAGHAAPGVVTHRPSACEGMDARLADVLRSRRGPDAVPPLPRGGAWLFVEVSGDDAADVAARAERLAVDAVADGALDRAVVTDPVTAARLWRIREDGAGLAGRAPSGLAAWAGWEDAAVPPARLGEYLAAFDELIAAHGLTCAPFGHFGEGCLHVRLDLPLGTPDGAVRLERFVTDAAQLVASFDGSLSGEHGDGRARSALLHHLYSPDALALLRGIKDAFDPGRLLNPGVLVDPDPVTAHLRVDRDLRPVVPLTFGYPADGGDLAAAVHRCTGVGKCRSDNSAAGGVMCPSYLATREERDSTRGRARVLQEALRGDTPAWDAPELADALDLCLSCKGCLSDCPTGVDMATYKSEVLHQRYRRRLRPRSHYALGRLPQWARLAGRAPRLVNRVMTLPGLRRVALAAAGVDRRRSVPPFATRTFRRWWADRPATDAAPAAGSTSTPAAGVAATSSLDRPVLLFVDSFSDAFSPAAARATVAVLQDAGFAPEPTGPRVCCALTWITTGQLDAARAILTRTVTELAVAARAGVPIVGIEPSCTAVLRHDAVDLLGDTSAADDARVVATATVTLAELLATLPDWSPPDLTGTTVIAQPHCHHHAVMGWRADEELLRRTGATVTRLAGCCGLAGNFGVESGHHEVSVAVAEQQLLPALDADPDAVVLADGFSCRTQVADLRHRPSRHLAELLHHGTSVSQGAVPARTLRVRDAPS